jgi:Flp pilus assembly protein TadG
MLEFALIAVLMLSLAFGVVEFGRAFHAALTVSHAARDGARVGMDPEADDPAIIAAVEAAAAPLDVEPPAIDRATGGQVEVTVTYEFETAAPFISEIWGGGSLTISRTMIGRIEG